ncbi:hypothetical protein A6V29_02725 [Blastococcus sp. CCUG 61487]|nr:hypothetical protein A6V29_02725 [Blastococcus sp. CCUG 61487]
MLTDSPLLPRRPQRSEQPGRMPPAGPLRLGSIAFPAGRAVIPRETAGVPQQSVVWITDDEIPAPGQAWAALAAQFPSTGLWPLLLSGLYDGSGRPWSSGELEPVSEAAIGELDAEAVLQDGWSGWLVPIRNPWPPGTGPLAPFNPAFPDWPRHSCRRKRTWPPRHPAALGSGSWPAGDPSTPSV